VPVTIFPYLRASAPHFPPNNQVNNGTVNIACAVELHNFSWLLAIGVKAQEKFVLCHRSRFFYDRYIDIRIMIASPAGAPPRRERLASLKDPYGGRATRSSTKAKKCPNAQCKTPDVQDLRGNRVCLSCGTLINDTNIVSEITFGENSAGAATVQGGYIGEGQRHANTLGSAFRRTGGVVESRQQSEANGSFKLSSIAALSLQWLTFWCR
jgi:hypothetical protein